MRKEGIIRKLIKHGEARDYCCPYCGKGKLELEEKLSVRDWRVGVRKRRHAAAKKAAQWNV